MKAKSSQSDSINDLFSSSKVLLLGPALDKKTTKKYIESKRQDGYVIISFSSSSMFFLKDISLSPDFHIFIDPQSYCHVLSEINPDFFADVNFLGYEMFNYESILNVNKKINGNPKFGISGFIKNKSYLSLYKTNPIIETYKNCFAQNPTFILNNEKSAIKQNICFQDDLYRFTNGSGEIDKLTYFLLPMVFYWFKCIKNLDLKGFGLFNQQRYKGGNTSSYKKYKQAYDKIVYLYRSIEFPPKIHVSIDHDSHFHDLKEILHND